MTLPEPGETRTSSGLTLRQRMDALGRLSVPSALLMAVEVLSALGAGHDRETRLCDITPHTIVVDQLEPLGSAVLLDVRGAGERRPWTGPAHPLEQAWYLAPEAAGLLNRDVDHRSQLYSLGVVLFEALAGRPPFEGQQVGAVLRQHLSAPVPSLRSRATAVPRALDAVVQRLMRKDPADRYQSADAVLVDLASIQQARDGGAPDGAVTIGLRDHRPTLTEPELVGRESELVVLEGLVAGAHLGRGGLVLVEAESGGGKTRLLQELAVRAGETGALVLHGQGVDQAARGPFQMLDGVAAALAQLLEHDPQWAADLRRRLGGRAGAVAAALPALGGPMGEAGPVRLGPEIFGETRSLEALSALLAGLGVANRPAVIVLDDCQWAGNLVTKLLARWDDLGRRRDGPVHVLIVTAFRSEEVGPTHGLRSMEGLAHLALGPIPAADIERLCQSMVGPWPDEALKAVTRLAEGSPFMAGAVTRGLVESGAVHHHPLLGWQVDPDQLAEAQTSRRAAAFLMRRLELLAPQTLALLSVGAVLGKRFDLDLARNVADAGPIEHNEDAGTADHAEGEGPGLAGDLEEAHRRGIVWLDEATGDCSFTHDRLRETLLSRLEPVARRELHLRAAARLEQVVPVPVFELAYHFDASGQGERALPYALRAAELGRSRHALDVAVAHYRMAERAGSQGAADVATRARIAEGLADVLTLQGTYDQADAELHRALALTTSRLTRATLEAKLGDVAFKRGQPAAARRHLEGAMRQLGRWVPSRPLGFFVAALWEALVQVAHTVAPRLLVGRGPAQAGEKTVAAMRIYSRLAYVYWFHAGKVACAWAHLREMNLAERYPPSEELAQAYSEHAPVMTMVPWYSRGLAYAQRSLAIRRAAGNTWGQGQSLGFQGVVLYAASRYRECIDQCREAVRLLEHTGDKWEQNTALWHLAFCHYRLGELGPALDIARRLHSSAASIGDQAATGISLSAWSRASGGRISEETVAPHLASDHGDAHTGAEVHLAEAVRLLHEGHVDAAIDILARAQSLVRRAGLRQEYVAPLSSWSATALRLRAEAMGPYASRAERAAALRRAGRASRRAVRVARAYANNFPHAARERALVAALQGRRRRAQRWLRCSMAVAERQGAAWEEAASMAALARVQGDQPGLEGAQRLMAAMEVPTTLEGAGAAVPTRDSISLADRFASLLETGRRVASAPSNAAVYQAVQEGGTTLLRGERCEVIEVTGGAIPEEDGGTGHLDQLSRRLLNRAVQERKSVVYQGENGEGTDYGELEGPRSALCAPVQSGGEVVACLYVAHHQLSGLFGAVELQLAEFIVELAGATLEQVAGAENRFRWLAQNSSDVITVVDKAGAIIYQSSAVERVFGFQPCELVGRPLSDWADPAEVARLLSRPSHADRGRDQALAQCRVRHRDGTWRHVEASLHDMSAEPSVGGLVLNIRDVSERVAMVAELRMRAWHDSLTGLANRDVFTDRMEHAVAQHVGQEGQFAVLLLDLDDFKSVNDRSGHRAGDLLLAAVGQDLRECVRPEDTVARLGGDEFAILLAGVAREEAERVARRIVGRLRQPHQLLGQEVTARASLGLVMSEPGLSAEELLSNADVAMYVAKSGGKGRHKVFEAGMRARALDRSALKTDLEGALQRRELVVHYQPVMTVATGAVAGFEALLRWDHPDRGLLAPGAFIDLAEETGLIVPIGAWVLEQACRQVKDWEGIAVDGGPLSMAVNVSAHQLQHSGIVEEVASALSASGLSPSALVLEITESATVQDSQAMVAKLRELEQLGVELAIDDFGTGYSSFSYLHRFPVSLLKIDRSFVAGLGRDQDDSAIVASMVSLAHTLGLEVVAEGVETPEQLDRLVDLGCDLAQGYNWLAPAQPEEVTRWMAARPAQAHTARPAQGLPALPVPLIRAVIVDDRQEARTAIRLAMETDGRFEVVGEATDGREAVVAARGHQPDLVVLDVHMPGGGGVEALPGVRTAAPEAGIVLLSAFCPDEVPPDLMAETLGFFDKATDLSDLVDRFSQLVH